MSVIVYGKPNCVQCSATERALNKSGIEYEKIDLTEDESALQYVRDLGYQAAPVVVAGEEHWSGFRPERVSALALAHQA